MGKFFLNIETVEIFGSNLYFKFTLDVFAPRTTGTSRGNCLFLKDTLKNIAPDLQPQSSRTSGEGKKRDIIKTFLRRTEANQINPARRQMSSASGIAVRERKP